MAVAGVLGFEDRRLVAGRYPVTDERGALVATIAKPVLRRRFDAYDAQGRPLCSGGVAILRGWTAKDPAGAVLVRLGSGLFRTSWATLADGSPATLRGAFFGRNWGLTGANGRELLSSVPHRAGLIFAPDSWLVGSEGTLSLAEIIAVVELHRLQVKQRRGANSS